MQKLAMSGNKKSGIKPDFSLMPKKFYLVAAAGAFDSSNLLLANLPYKQHTTQGVAPRLTSPNLGALVTPVA
jgi:hypothetical protein